MEVQFVREEGLRDVKKDIRNICRIKYGGWFLWERQVNFEKFFRIRGEEQELEKEKKLCVLEGRKMVFRDD